MIKKITSFVTHVVQKVPDHIYKIYVGIGILTSIIFVVLVIEYRYFVNQTDKMLELKEDYRNHLLAVKQVLSDYNKAKERIDELEALVDQQKKKGSEADLITPSTVFDDDARVYSSDDTDDDENESFVVINRDLEYLKRSTFNYFKKQKLGLLAPQANSDYWLDYTEQIIKQKNDENKKLAASHGKKRRARVRLHRPAQPKQPEYVMASRHMGIQDMALMWPILRSKGQSDFWISSPFGMRRRTGRFHYGIDMAAIKGTPVVAAASGVVVEAQRASGYGNTILIAHNHKYRTRYAHLNRILVRVGQKVNRGDLIGKVGDTGFTMKSGRDASHLHFEVYAFGKPVNPIYFLR